MLLLCSRALALEILDFSFKVPHKTLHNVECVTVCCSDNAVSFIAMQYSMLQNSQLQGALHTHKHAHTRTHTHTPWRMPSCSSSCCCEMRWDAVRCSEILFQYVCVLQCVAGGIVGSLEVCQLLREHCLALMERCELETSAQCNTLQHTTTHYNTLQHTALLNASDALGRHTHTHTYTHKHTQTHMHSQPHTHMHTNANTHRLTHTCQDTRVPNTNKSKMGSISNAVYTCCNTLHHAAPRCNTLQHAATRCNTLQHAAKRCNAL